MKELENGVGMMMMINSKLGGKQESGITQDDSSVWRTKFSLFLKMKKKDHVDTHTHTHTLTHLFSLLFLCCCRVFQLRGVGVND